MKLFGRLRRPIIELLFLIALLTGISLRAQNAPDLIAPQVFLRAIQTGEGTRYTAAIVKTPDNAALRNLSVEITLPASAELIEMIVPRQVQFDVIRRNRAGQLTLIWQISRVDSASPLDPYSFTLAEPLTEELEFYAQWIDDSETQRVENFFELPPPIIATQPQAVIDLTVPRFTLIEGMGVQAALPDANPLRLDVTLLSADFNPPPQYGDFWWCSLLSVQGIPQAKTIQVIVPLRRPLAPFTPLGMFQQQPDGSWSPLTDQAVVTADGQFALYTHPGGVIATGVDAEVQPELITAQNLVIVDLPDLPPLPTDIPAQPTNTEPPPLPTTVTDGSSNTIIISEATFTPLPVNTGDGSSNTIFISEATFTPTITTDGSVRFITALPFIETTPTNTPPLGSIPDGSSNTIILGEATFTPTITRDGSVRFITALPFIETTPTNTPPLGSIPDGSSNTIILGEATFTPTITRDGNVRFIAALPFIETTPTNTPPLGNIPDGSSNTIILGEATFTPSPAPDSAAVIVTLEPTFTETPRIAPTLPESAAVTLEPTFTETPRIAPTLPEFAAVTLEVTLTETPRIAPTLPESAAVTLEVALTETPRIAPTIPEFAAVTLEVTLTETATLTTAPTITDTPTLEPTLTETPTLEPTLTFTPSPAPTRFVTATPISAIVFGTGTITIEIIEQDGIVLQCQVGEINCAAPARRPGGGLR